MREREREIRNERAREREIERKREREKVGEKEEERTKKRKGSFSSPPNFFVSNK